MKICDLDHLELIRPTANSDEIKVTGGIEIQVGSSVLALGDVLSLVRTFSFTFAYAPPVFQVTPLVLPTD